MSIVIASVAGLTSLWHLSFETNQVMPMKFVTPKNGLMLVAAVLALAGGTVETFAQERLPWLSEGSQSGAPYADSRDVDRDRLPPAHGSEQEPPPYSNNGPRPSYGDATRDYNSAPRAGEGGSGYSRNDDRYQPPANGGGGSFGSVAPRPYGQDEAYGSAARGNTYDAPRTSARDDAYRPPARAGSYDSPRPFGGRDEGYRAPDRYDSSSTAPYPPPRSDEPEWQDERDRPPYRDRFASSAPPYDDRGPPPRDGTYSMREVVDAGHGFFGSASKGMASIIEYAFRTQGRPNGYILGEDAGGAFVAGLRYGEGRLYTREAGTHRVFWQGPSLGYDAGAEGSKVMVLIYNLRDPSDIYQRFGGVAGSAYVVGGVGITFQQRDNIVLAPIRAGIGLRLGANVGYLKYTRRPTWNPF